MEKGSAAVSVTYDTPVESRDGDYMTESSLWQPEGVTVCECQGCGWRVEARGESGRISSFAQEHVEEYGHSVVTIRQQMRVQGLRGGDSSASGSARPRAVRASGGQARRSRSRGGICGIWPPTRPGSALASTAVPGRVDQQQARHVQCEPADAVSDAGRHHMTFARARLRAIAPALATSACKQPQDLESPESKPPDRTTFSTPQSQTHRHQTLGPSPRAPWRSRTTSRPNRWPTR